MSFSSHHFIISALVVTYLFAGLTNCKTLISYVPASEVEQKKIPLVILEDFAGNKFSTGKLKTMEKVLLFVFTNDQQLNSFIEPKNEYWQIFDGRNRSWYEPGFWFYRTVKQNAKLMADETNGLLDQLKLDRQARVIVVEMGNIQKIISLEEYNSLKKKKEADNTPEN